MSDQHWCIKLKMSKVTSPACALTACEIKYFLETQAVSSINQLHASWGSLMSSNARRHLLCNSCRNALPTFEPTNTCIYQSSDLPNTQTAFQYLIPCVYRLKVSYSSCQFHLSKVGLNQDYTTGTTFELIIPS